MNPPSSEAKDLVFIGDVHLEEEDPALEDFLAFLGAISATTSRVVLVGDLFNLWLGRPELELSHQRAVLARLEELRRRGVVVRYLEGNRDFRIGRGYIGRALDEATDTGIVERFGGVSLFAIHGDLANASDRQYRAWRRLSRSRPVWAAFNVLSRGLRLRVAHVLEDRMRRSNLRHKGSFPEAAVRDYAARYLRAGHHAVVLGHFHVEKDLRALPPSPSGRILVLPEWKGSRRHLRVSPRGEIGFVESRVPVAGGQL